MNFISLTFDKTFDPNHDCFKNNEPLRKKIESRFNSMRMFLNKNSVGALTTSIIDGNNTYKVRVNK